MINTQRSPEIFVNEAGSFPPSVADATTGVPAFIGYTEWAKGADGTNIRGKPVRIKSLMDYERHFGGPDFRKDFLAEINDRTDVLGNVLSRTIKVSGSNTTDRFILYYGVRMFFENGGRSCYIISVGYYQSAVARLTELGNNNLKNGGLDVLEQLDEPSLVVIPDAQILPEAEYFTLCQDMLRHCTKVGNRFAILDTYRDGNLAPSAFRNFIGTENLKNGAVYHPFLVTTCNDLYRDKDVRIRHTVDFPTPAASAGVLNGKTLNEVKQLDAPVFDRIALELKNIYVTLPPASIVAGAYARVDQERGVWKSPANVPVHSVIKPTLQIGDAEQQTLNVDAVSGKSVNVIRTFPGKGTIVWGARTLMGNDNEFRYVPVRRFFLFASESIKTACEAVVFEPNDANTWVKVQAMIENWLTLQWRAGALMGVNPQQAFFVGVGLGKSMTSLDVLEGRMIVEIGMAVLRPAEFIIMRLAFKMPES
jgi:uncharacterized protein